MNKLNFFDASYLNSNLAAIVHKISFGGNYEWKILSNAEKKACGVSELQVYTVNLMPHARH